MIVIYIIKKNMNQNMLILERSSQNLKTVNHKGKTILEGVFAEFGKENRNGRIYEEKEYLPHLDYLKKDMNAGNLLGELDHPERFEVSLGGVSHRINELWYDDKKRQVLGRIEILNGTPKGQIAEALLKAGVPLSISSRAAGSVNEDKTVDIQQIYTYDLVAKPGFEAAQLHTINESEKPRIDGLIKQLNESSNSFEKTNPNLSDKLGIINENVSIYELKEEPKLRQEALKIISKNKSEIMNESKKSNDTISENAIQEWTDLFTKELGKVSKKIQSLESKINESASTDVEDLSSANNALKTWVGDIAKAVNKIGNQSQKLTEASNKQNKVIKKITETVDFNATTLNHTIDWVGKNAKVTNAIAETVDHNAHMLNGINEWNTELAKGINKLNEWGEEKAKAINQMHEWTSSIAKGLNESAQYSETQINKNMMTKKDATKLVEYVELVSAGKNNPELKKKLEETIKANNKTSINESIKGLDTITTVAKVGNVDVNTNASKESGVEFDGKIITAKIKDKKLSGSGKPKELNSKVDNMADAAGSSNGSSVRNVKGIMTLDTTTKGSKPSVKVTGDGPTSKTEKAQKLKLDVKAEKDLNEKQEGFNKSKGIKSRQSKLDEKLSKIIDNIEKEKMEINETANNYPFIKLLSEADKKEFKSLDESDKQKIATEIASNPTNDSKTIKALWENALSTKEIVEEPIWLKAAPQSYKKLYENADERTQGSISARAEFIQFPNQYAIDNFWQQTGLKPKTPTTLNEVVMANGNTGKELVEDDYDQTISGVMAHMKKYNS